MLRRQLIQQCTSWYRWARAKVSALASVSAKLNIIGTIFLRSNRKVKVNDEAELSVNNACEFLSTDVTSTGLMSNAAEAPTVEASATAKFAVKHKATLFGYLRAPMRYAIKCTTKLLAKSSWVGSSVASARDKVELTVGAHAVEAHGSRAISADKTYCDTVAAATCSVAMSAGANDAVTVVQSAPLHWWLYPEIDENQSLHVRQAYVITQNENTLEVS